MTTAYIGQPVSRVDGRQKVTGGATYAAEFDIPDVAHGAIDHEPGDASRLRGYRKYFAPSTRKLIALGIGNQHHARFGVGHGLMQHQIVARRAAHRHSHAADMRTWPHRPDLGIHHALQPGRLIQCGRVEFRQPSQRLRRNSHAWPFA